jgi:hypothetical protein
MPKDGSNGEDSDAGSYVIHFICFSMVLLSFLYYKVSFLVLCHVTTAKLEYGLNISILAYVSTKAAQDVHSV